MSKLLNIGVVGYSSGKFNEDVAKALIAIALDVVEENETYLYKKPRVF